MNICQKYFIFTIAGVGYTFAMLRFGTDMHNVMLATVALVSISHVVRENHFKHVSQCSRFDNGTHECLSMYPKVNHTKVCTSKGFTKFTDYVATQYYFR